MGCGLLVLAMLANIQQFMMRKISYWGYADFYSDKGDYDVLFLGSSTMNMGISPMELWNDYGITSYNMADDAQRLPVDYWVLKNALAYTKHASSVSARA